VFNGPELPMSILFVCAAAVFVLRGPFGRALADRIAGRSGTDDREVRELRGEVDALRHELTEMQERFDFTERLLAKHRDAAFPKLGA
jgi:hypothetical protein